MNNTEFEEEDFLELPIFIGSTLDVPPVGSLRLRKDLLRLLGEGVAEIGWAALRGKDGSMLPIEFSILPRGIGRAKATEIVSKLLDEKKGEETEPDMKKQKVVKHQEEKEEVNFRPLGKRVLAIRTKEIEEVGGILIPERARERPLRAKVVEVGKGVQERIPVGSTVLFDRYAPAALPYETEDGEPYVLISEDKILAVEEQP